MVTADFNSDGKPDLAVLNAVSRNISVLLGNGFGGFTPAPGAPWPAGRNAGSLEAADLNGDGAADLAIGNSDTSGVTVLLGNGAGGFTAPGGAFPTGGGADSVVAADFNGDGRADLVASDIASGIYVLLGAVSPTGTLLSTTVPATVQIGQSIPLRAQVSTSGAYFAAATGSVSFFDGATALGTAALSGGVAAFTIASVTPGVHTITAVYSGDSRSAPSMSNALAFAPPPIRVSGIANGASFQPGVAAPNTILSLFGSNLACASTPKVILDGVATEILAAVDSQINFVTPPSVVPGVVMLEVVCGTDRSQPYPLATAVSAPSIFTASGAGLGQASIVNQNGSFNSASSPAVRGEYVSVYATGLGRYADPDAAGLTWMLERAAFFFGDAEGTVLFAGAAPGYTAGLQQINVQIPPTAPVGPAVPGRLTIGAAATRQSVTIAIQ